MNRRNILLCSLLCLIPVCLQANEPIVPLMILFAGPSLLGVVFGGVGFFIVVAIKIGVFFWKSDFRSVHVIWYILVANIFSTFIGLVVSAMFSSSFAFLPGVVILYFIFLIPGRRLRQFRSFQRFSTWSIAFWLLIVTGITVFVFGLMAGYYDMPYIYWPLKILMATLGITISLIISVLYEEAIIAELYKRQFKKTKSFVQPVLWGNIIGLALFALIGAAIALPQRLRSPDFLIERTTDYFFDRTDAVRGGLRFG
jgi:MFS family permease